MTQTPALDFLRKVEVWQETEGGTAGVQVVMPVGEETTLSQLLGTFRRMGPSAQLEEQARHWLIGYREAENFSPMLTTDQKRELDAVIAGLPSKPVSRRHMPWDHWLRSPPRVSVAIVLVILLSALALLLISKATSHPANDVPQGSQVQQHQPAQQIPAGTTALQDFKNDWGPWKQIPVDAAHPQTGVPAGLLYMEQGTYYVSESWTIPASSPGWSPDLGGNVGAVNVEGSHASITDMDGNPYIAGIDQPFVFSQNPGTVLKIDPTGTVTSIPEAHAMNPNVRKHL